VVQTPASQKQKTVSVYLHTHWDREWYFPFETYRIHLLHIVEKLLLELQANKLPAFVLDGQTCVLEDVLAIKPELRQSIAECMSQGKLEAGPWYVLADQMLVGGESLIRNLAIGMETAEEFGKSARAGYNPDTFSHSADLPRILKGFGIETALVWRGVPGKVGDPVFRWRSPDGSEVICYHMPRGYYNVALHENADKDKLVHFLREYCERSEKAAPCWSPKTEMALVPIGGDHTGVPTGITEVLAALEASGGNYSTKINTLTGFCEELVQKTKDMDLFVLQGELRDNADAFRFLRAFVLPGVLSARLYLKQENRESERRLIRQIEPVSAMLSVLKRAEYPKSELKHSWKLLLKNHPHDSICGTSTDAVHREMRSRTEKLQHALDGIESCLLEKVNHAKANQSSNLFGSINGLDSNLWFAEPGQFDGKMLVANNSASTLSVPVAFAMAVDSNNKSSARYAGSAESEETKNSGTAFDTTALAKLNRIQIVERRKVTALFAGEGKEPLVKDIDLDIGYVFAEDLPPHGFKTLDLAGWKAPLESPCTLMAGAYDLTLENESLRVVLSGDGSVRTSAKDANQSVPEVKWRFNLWDQGDGGDSYNFDPVPVDRPIPATLESISMGLQGPLAVSVLLTHRIAIPVGVEVSDDEIAPGLRKTWRSEQTIEHFITTEIMLKRGVPLLLFRTYWNNQCRDHRLEVRFELEESISATFSENHFSLIRREGGVQTEAPLPVSVGSESIPARFPCQRFFTANGHAFFNAGLPEYGFWDNTVSITLLRAFSKLSKSRLWTRGSGAGPGLDTPEANCLGFNMVRYAWAPLSFTGVLPSAPESGEQSPMHPFLAARCYELVDYFDAAWLAWPLCKNAEEIPGQSLLYLSNGAIRSTSLFQKEEWLTVRLLNATQRKQETILSINFPFTQALETNLKGDQLNEPVGHRLDPEANNFGSPCFFRLEFAPNELKTMAFKL
jgi:mannosylglycerate hydrolase